MEAIISLLSILIVVILFIVISIKAVSNKRSYPLDPEWEEKARMSGWEGPEDWIKDAQERGWKPKSTTSGWYKVSSFKNCWARVPPRPPTE